MDLLYRWFSSDFKNSLFFFKKTVPPAEIEALLISHPEVVDSGVIGVFSDVAVTELPRSVIQRID